MKKIICAYLFFILQGVVYPQFQDTTFSGINKDTLRIQGSQVQADTALAADSLKRQSDINAVIYASGTDSLIFRIPDRKMEIYGKSELKYKQTDLKSANIFIDFKTNRIQAEGVVDTSDTSKGGFTGTPVLSEAGEIYEGQSINYDFKTQRGFISLAKNASEGAVYGGNKVKKVDKNVYFIQNGTYTTCEEDPTDFYFYAKEMKVILKEQIIAKWIWLYIAGVPLPLPLPIGVFPNQSGRRSGIIPPAYGQTADLGYYFSHLGYFWAISDYMDINFTSDIYTRGSFRLNSIFRYTKRYSLNGSVFASYGNMKYGSITDPDFNQEKVWNLSARHHQDINPSTRLDANLSFQSSGYLKTQRFNYNDVLQQTITSDATLSKNWDESGNSMTLNYHRTQYLNNGDIQEYLPSVSFSMSQKYPFRREGKVDPQDQKWYELFGIGYSSELRNERNKREGKLESRAGLSHRVRAIVSPKVGYFTIGPSVTYNEKWYLRRIEKVNYIVADKASPGGLKDSVVEREIRGFNAVRTFDLGLGASTKFFGILQPRALGIEAFRHMVTPTVSYSFRPDFSKPGFGYYGSYINAQGQEVKYSHHEDEIYGGATQGEEQQLNFSLGNVFEIKTMKDPTDTTSEQKKIQLLNLDANIGYNFAASQNRLRDLSVSYRTQIGEFINLNSSTTHSFYDYDQQRNTISPRYLLSQGKGLMRLTDFRLSLSSSISGDKLKGKSNRDSHENQSETQRDINSMNEAQRRLNGIYSDEPPDFSIPWDLSLSFNYSMDKSDPDVIRKSSGMNASFNFSLTQTLKISFSGSYDLVRKELLTPSIRIYKDLHCWEASFNWQPLGAYRGYFFLIKIKAPQLQDIKLERTRGAMSGRYF